MHPGIFSIIGSEYPGTSKYLAAATSFKIFMLLTHTSNRCARAMEPTMGSATSLNAAAAGVHLLPSLFSTTFSLSRKRKEKIDEDTRENAQEKKEENR